MDLYHLSPTADQDYGQSARVPDVFYMHAAVFVLNKGRLIKADMDIAPSFRSASDVYHTGDVLISDLILSGIGGV